MATYPMPLPADIAKFYHGLLGKKTEVKKATQALQILPKPPVVIGYYIDDQTQIVGLILGDFAFACFSGSALALVPPKVASDALKSGEPNDGILENVHEVMNVSAALINNMGAKHLKLNGITLSNKEIQEKAQTIIAKPAARADFDVNIDGYGACKMAFLLGSELAK